MINKISSFFFLTYFWTIYSGCAIVGKEQSVFKIKEAYYQSWMVNENEKGTTIVIELINVEHGVKFDSIIFRGNMLPVFTNVDGNSTMLKSILNVGIGRIAMESKTVGLSDRLIYSYKEKKYSLPIQTFQRKKTKQLK